LGLRLPFVADLADHRHPLLNLGESLLISWVIASGGRWGWRIGDFGYCAYSREPPVVS
jgi:hypothetical protein